MILLQAFIRGAIVLLGAGLLTLVFSHRSAALRHHIWASALIIQLALLWLIPAMPEMPLGLPLPPVASVFNVPTPSVPVASTSTYASATSATAQPNTSTASQTPAEPTDWKHVMLYVWLTGAALVLLRYLIGTLLMARTARYGRRVDEGEWLSLSQRVARELGITRPVTLLWGDKLIVPITWGVLYPMVLLPESAHEWPLERRRFVLVHELAHIKRFDALTQLVAQLAVAFFWFSPFVWLAEWRLRVEREHACDDVVLHHGTDASLYANELLQMVRSLINRGTAQPAFAALAMARRSEFEGRMLAILDPARRRGGATITSSALFMLLSLVIAAPVAAVDVFVVDSTVKPAPVATKPPAPAAAKPALKQAAAFEPCDMNSTSTATHVEVLDDSPARNTIGIKLSRPGWCLQADMRGQFTFNEDETSIEKLGAGSVIQLREETSQGYVDLHVVPNGDGVKMTVENTVPMKGSASVHQWIARVLPIVLREAAIEPDARIARMVSAHGLRGTLETIESIGSLSSRATHYIALLKARHWGDAELNQIGRSAARSLEGSSDLQRVLEAMPRQVRSSAENWLESALSSITSSGDKAAALTAHIAGADRATLLMLARVSKTISSSADKSSFLTAAAPHMLTRRDAELDDAWFSAVATIGSSYNRANSLTAAITYAYGNPALRERIAHAAAQLGNEEKTNVLTALSTVR